MIKVLEVITMDKENMIYTLSNGVEYTWQFDEDEFKEMTLEDMNNKNEVIQRLVTELLP